MTILPSLNHPPYRNTALDGIGRRLAFESEKCQDKSKVVSSLFRNVPFLTSLEMSLSFDLMLSLGCPLERSPAPRFVRRV